MAFALLEVVGADKVTEGLVAYRGSSATLLTGQ